MKKLIQILLILVCFQAMAQNSMDPNHESHISESGKLFTIKIVPGSKESSFYIVGKEFAKIKIDALNVTASLIVNGKEKSIRLNKQSDKFTTEEKLTGEYLKLEIEKKQNPKEKETLQIKLKP